MKEELTLCAAAFFRNKGKTVTTSGEFLMSISMDYHWFPLDAAKKIFTTMLSENILEKNGDIVKPCFDVGAISVPVAYKPDSGLASKCSVPTSEPVQKEEATEEPMLPRLIEKATSNGMEKKDFISQANHISKTLNVDMIVAGLLVLRENGIDFKEFVEPVYSEIKSK